MLVKLLRDWRCYLRGDIADLGRGVCVELIRRGICEEVVVPVPLSELGTAECVKVEEVEVAAMEPRAETQVKRKRGRPRKYPERYADGN